MEIVNHSIQIQISENTDIERSFFVANSEEQYFHLYFGLNAKDCQFDLEKDTYLVHIRFANSYFEKYGEVPHIYEERQDICCNVQTLLLNLIHSKLTGVYRKIYFESTILYLLYQSQKNRLLHQPCCGNCSGSHKHVDVDKMVHAKTFILDNLANNLTIQIIAGAVGTNQLYLKKGFKEVFNQTIFDFIQENRMIKAKYLLQNSGVRISEIAHAVGYASLSSFSQAYKNYYGISPVGQLKTIITAN